MFCASDMLLKYSVTIDEHTYTVGWLVSSSLMSLFRSLKLK